MENVTPVVLSIAGSDCSSGAGLQADLKVGCALGCYTLTAVTCVVSEIPGCVSHILPMPPELVADQVRLCLTGFPVAAIKTGMLYSADILRAASQQLPKHVPLVVDPVMIATAGKSLMRADTLRAYEEYLFPRATLITPNAGELIALARLTACPCAENAVPEVAAHHVAARYGCAVLAKGGHLPGKVCRDILVFPDGRTQVYTHTRTLNIPTHGTGCTLSAAIAALLAHGEPLPQAVEQAVHFTAASITHSLSWPSHRVFALSHQPYGRGRMHEAPC